MHFVGHSPVGISSQCWHPISMKKIAFLTCDSLPGIAPDDVSLVNELTRNGQFLVETPSWRSSTNWTLFDFVIIRSTWDYTSAPVEFLNVLQKISSETTLLNSFEVVNWNYHKGYLKELASKGILIVPTLFFSHDEKIEIPSNWPDKLIIKPAISATSSFTSIVERDSFPKLHPADWLCQPYLENITEGEISLHYFDAKFSHACLKIPKSGDFRVQEDFGGRVVGYAPDSELLLLGQNIISAIPFKLLYARVDLIAYEGSYALMELELIEPSLHFRSHPGSEKNFAAAFSNFAKAK